MTIVSFEVLNTCATNAEQQLIANGQWDAAVAQAGSPDAVRHAIVDACLKSLGSTVTADQLTACAQTKLNELKADPAGYELAKNQAGGEIQLQAAVIAICLESLQTTVPVVATPAAVKKTTSYWPWVVGGVGAVVLVGGIYAMSQPTPKKGKKAKGR